MLICRFLLGVAEAGFFPGMIYYLTFWYRPQDRALRIAMLYLSAAIAGACKIEYLFFIYIFSGGGFVAYFILSNMNGIGGLFAYQWIFIIEGNFDVSIIY